MQTTFYNHTGRSIDERRVFSSKDLTQEYTKTINGIKYYEIEYQELVKPLKMQNI